MGWPLALSGSLGRVGLLPLTASAWPLLALPAALWSLVLNPADHFKVLQELSPGQTQPDLPQSQKAEAED